MSRIMIVDDSAMMRHNLKIMLEQDGHTIAAEAADGLAALQEYRTNLPDLVTMDITMPKVNGLEAVRDIVAEFPDANIIIVSALNDRTAVVQARENGARHYLIKPISREKLLRVVNEVLVK